MEVVLVHPCIPQNTGSIARTCAAMAVPLHIIYPIGFEISEKRVRRAGLDYWPHVDLRTHDSWAAFKEQTGDKQLWMFSRFSTQASHQVQYKPNDILVFGSETEGLPEEIVQEVSEEYRLRIPMQCEGVRSLNLSNAVSIGLFEALRQCDLLGE